MTPEHHRHRAERIGRSLARLTDADWEIRIEAAMLAGTHWVNYALHQRGISTAQEDMVHASMCLVSILRKYRLAEPQLIEQLEEIEELRPLFVRLRRVLPRPHAGPGRGPPRRSSSADP